jgi:hypothetical protein
MKAVDFSSSTQAPAERGEELADVLMSRYEKLSTIVTSNRPIDD